MSLHWELSWRASSAAMLLGVAICSCQASPPGGISGTVTDEHGPVAGATVRVQTTDIDTVTGDDGRFSLTPLSVDDPVTITAWATGYYIAAAQDIRPGAEGVQIRLQAHPSTDNPDYAWLPSQAYPGTGENQGCAKCHSSAGSDIPYSLPVDEWLQDAHSQSARNPQFLAMYLGTDLAGNQSPPTRFGFAKDYGSFPLLPDPTQAYFGPGYRLDFPQSAGNCAACHTPAAAIRDPYGVDPSIVEDVEAEGVPCDFCHKVWDVAIDPESGLPRPNAPGVLSFTFRRPPDGHQFFAGPLDDVAPGEDTFSPLQRQSQICAPCHFGVFWDTVIYNSFGEWLDSPYSDPESGRTCQDCHMPPLGVTHFARPDQGGLARPAETIFSHRMPGASDPTLLQNAVNLTASASHEGDSLHVEVEILNDQTGHDVPTDSPLRHMILLVDARDRLGNRLAQVDGPTVPAWGGVGDPDEGYYAGLPGKGYAKILTEVWTRLSPTGSYWNPTRLTSDNRIGAFQSDKSSYVFALSEEGGPSEIEVHVQLIFRRAFKELMDQKSWQTPDIVMEEAWLSLP